jgi:hypothetical protein
MGKPRIKLRQSGLRVFIGDRGGEGREGERGCWMDRKMKKSVDRQHEPPQQILFILNLSLTYMCFSHSLPNVTFIRKHYIRNIHMEGSEKLLYTPGKHQTCSLTLQAQWVEIPICQSNGFCKACWK